MGSRPRHQRSSGSATHRPPSATSVPGPAGCKDSDRETVTRPNCYLAVLACCAATWSCTGFGEASGRFAATSRAARSRTTRSRARQRPSDDPALGVEPRLHRQRRWDPLARMRPAGCIPVPSAPARFRNCSHGDPSRELATQNRRPRAKSYGVRDRTCDRSQRTAPLLAHRVDSDGVDAPGRHAGRLGRRARSCCTLQRLMRADPLPEALDPALRDVNHPTHGSSLTPRQLRCLLRPAPCGS